MSESRLCDCGCGHPAPLAQCTRSDRGYVKGQPVRFIKGHSGRKPDRWYEVDRGHDTPCWIWLLATDPKGYGRVGVGGRTVRLAHRVYWEEANGPIPDGLQLDHLCRVPACVNPDHLEAVTPRENVLRGLAPSAVNARKTHCVHGHVFDAANTHILPRGERVCRRCRRRRLRELAARRARTAA